MQITCFTLRFSLEDNCQSNILLSNIHVDFYILKWIHFEMESLKTFLPQGIIIIHEVYPDGAAARDGRLWAGDQVLEVNNVDLRSVEHEVAIQTLRQSGNRVRMLVFRDEKPLEEKDLYDILTLDFMKKAGKGLGISIVGRKNDAGVYVSEVVSV